MQLHLRLQFTMLHTLLPQIGGMATVGYSVFAPPGASLPAAALLTPRSLRGVSAGDTSVHSARADSPPHFLPPGCPTQHSAASPSTTAGHQVFTRPPAAPRSYLCDTGCGAKDR
ncbi:hypothetical protein NDU88_009027 [Pleurodeles waltl]|uniref:Uncharacterized protein n=1 Tax=Pleurodeles waltl TaxID=8319 RepID=A0AAV7PUQ8_PLEWA|nr:hypothetical protein NDU88_009025 [Pleurodeles waltl]KAJ1130676.1 hypothetical protein NDU88_009026 [Pleurodeles waltl]KAJ1130677.1 hypothetical protein NDU88_009027 [Pleurodeles waltl]